MHLTNIGSLSFQRSPRPVRLWLTLHMGGRRRTVYHQKSTRQREADFAHVGAVAEPRGPACRAL